MAGSKGIKIIYLYVVGQKIYMKKVAIEMHLHTKVNINLFIKRLFAFLSVASIILYVRLQRNYRSSVYQIKNLIQKNIASLKIYGPIQSKYYKYILFWTRNYYINEEESMFMKNCSISCYITTNRMLLKQQFNFDAIIFDLGRLKKWDFLPHDRSPHQKYIFYSHESPDYSYPICKKQFDGFFNWTATYRLNSDIPLPYIQIRDSKGEIVGPKQKMQWVEQIEVLSNNLFDKIRTKTKAAAAKTRYRFVQALNKALKSYGMRVDIYGKCGNLHCHRNQTEYCNDMLARDYFFYMSLENSLHEDYVTEKLVRAMQYNVIPIVYGGADYSRFLPPGSYIDGRKLKIVELAALMHRLMQFPREYSQYFWWKTHYTYHEKNTENWLCSICEALYDKDKVQNRSVYSEFRKWWDSKCHHSWLIS